MTRVLDLSVPLPQSGERLDRFLAAAQTDLSRNALQSLIRDGRVAVNGATARASRRVREGDRVRVELPPPREASPALGPEAIPIDVVFEDADVIVLDKPAGLTVHPGAGRAHGTLVNALLHRYPEIGGVGGAGRPGVVHRLDKDTSGLMIVARSPRAYRALIEAMRARTVRRTYAALVWGDPSADSGTIDTAFGRHPVERTRMAVIPRGGRRALTHWRVQERFGVAALLRVELETGRTHQIRVHLAHVRHPVVGDALYGGRGKKSLSLRESQRRLAIDLLQCLPRQALHAAALELSHPVSGGRLAFTAPLPDDFARALDMLRASRVRDHR